MTIDVQAISDLLEAAGIAAAVDLSDKEKGPNTTDYAALLTQMEAWLGLSSSNNNNESGMLTASDCGTVPLSVSVHWRRLLMAAWQSSAQQPQQQSSSSLLGTQQHVNLLLESNLSPDEISLEAVWDSVKVTKWLQGWMELPLDVEMPNIRRNQTDSNVDNNDNDNDNDNSDTLEYHWMWLLDEQMDQLLEQPATRSSPIPSPRLLIQALYHHIEQLPLLQTHLHAYTHSLQQPPSPHRLATSSPSHDNNRHSHTLTPSVKISPQQRLEALAISQQVSQRLLQQWAAHTAILQKVLALWYRASSTQFRSLQRSHLASVWHSYLLRSTVATPMVTRHENTQAASLLLSLQTLHVILAGLPPSTTPRDNDDNDNDTTNNSLQQGVHEHLLFHSLVPLHQPNALVLWRDQTPLLSLYHEPLTQCTALLVQRHVDWLPALLQALVEPDVFPVAGHTNKQVLLLHEMDTYLGLFAETLTTTRTKTTTSNKVASNNATNKDAGEDDNTESHRVQQLWNDQGSAWWLQVCRVVTRCMASDHSGLAERALQLAKNTVFMELVQRYATECLPLFLSALVPKNAQVSWNPTVRKMTYLVLQKIKDTIPPHVLEQAARDHFDSTISSHRPPAAPPRAISSAAKIKKKKPLLPPTNRSMPPPTAKQNVAGGVLGTSWKPPPRGMPPPASRRTTPGRGKAPWAGGAPPSTITGVAPWASSSLQQKQPPQQQKQQQPPVTITGVAPWAHSTNPTATATTRSKPKPSLRQKRHMLDSSVVAEETEEDQDEPMSNLQEEEDHDKDNDDDDKLMMEGLEGEEEEEESGDTNFTSKERDLSHSHLDTSPGQTTGVDRLLDYMAKLKPPEEEDEGGASSWSKIQMAETPTLLPTLKFHDLVFGHDLGSGSFGTVRYARLIERSKTRSKWAEYAVKVVSTQKIRELGYEASIRREIAVLRLLSHPGIARLISSFRFREGAYLVLEYASQGDLYTLLRQQGSLDHDATRFVIGELVAALSSIHELGLVYGDLKPENCVITELGHIKLTDFGGCRPVTREAKERIQTIARNALRDLRDGDWMERLASAETGSENEAMQDNDHDMERKDQNDELEEDLRVEGTTAYLPPEVVLGTVPTIAADAWALGCVMYQCLSGRPPLLDVDEEATRQRIVTFDSDTGEKDEVEALFQDKHSMNISQPARQLIGKMLNRNPAGRPDMQEIARHEFFAAAAVQVFSLHKQEASPLEVGSVAPPAADAQWARRQYSSIWAPQPAQYNLSLEDGDSFSGKKHKSALSALAASPIPQGEEATAAFSIKQFSSAHSTSETASISDNTQSFPSNTVLSLSQISERNPLPSG